MIVLSAGMQKAGSAWYFNLSNDLIVAAGHDDIRVLRRKYLLQHILTEVNCNIGTLHPLKLLWVSLPHVLGRTYAVKTHAAPTSLLMRMIDRGWVKATYIHRDPRDVAVSLFRHGERIRTAGVRSDTGFDALDSMEKAISFAKGLIDIWEAWARSGKALLVRYEDLRRDPRREIDRLLDHLALQLPDESIRSVIARYEVREPGDHRDVSGLHFDKGVSGRWREELTPEQKRLCDDLFGAHLEAKGYPRN